jgi:hypothetical protein
MPKKSSDPNAPYVSLLETHAPQYLSAIGTLSVEIVHMEVALASLLGAMTRLPPNVAQTIYFAPQSTGLRIAIVKASAKECLRAYPHHLGPAKRCCEDASRLSNKRNEIIHQAWGLNADGDISSSALPISEASTKHIPLSQIEDVVHRLRLLMARLRDLIDVIATDQTYSPWPERLPARVQGATSNSHQEAPHPEHQDRHRSSQA